MLQGHVVVTAHINKKKLIPTGPVFAFSRFRFHLCYFYRHTYATGVVGHEKYVRHSKKLPGCPLVASAF